MGMLSALIVGPCVAPPLMGALIYISQTGDGLLGGLALFSLAMGMGAPLLLVGTSAGKLLPKAGAWMDAVKAAFGVVLLGVAVWLLERILPSAVTMVLIAALMVGSDVAAPACASRLTSASPSVAGRLTGAASRPARVCASCRAAARAVPSATTRLARPMP